MNTNKETAAERKERLISQILKQDAYKTNSGLYQQIAKGLLKLNVVELGQLAVILGKHQ